MGIADVFGVVSNVDKTIKKEKLKEKRAANKMKINKNTILKVLREIVKPDNYKINLFEDDSPDTHYADKLHTMVCDESFNMRHFHTCLIYNGDDSSINIYKTLEKEMDKIDRSVWDINDLIVRITMKTKYFNVFFKCYHPDNYDTKNSEKIQGYYQFLIEIVPKSDMIANTFKAYKFNFTLNKLIWNCGGFEFPSINNIGKDPTSYTNKDVNDEFNNFAELFKE